MFRDHSVCIDVRVTTGVGGGPRVAASARDGRDGCSPGIMGARCIHVVLRPSVDCLNHALCVGTIIRPDSDWLARRGGKTGWRECNRVQIRPFSDRGVAKDDKQAGVVSPLDFEAAADAVVV